MMKISIALFMTVIALSLIDPSYAQNEEWLQLHNDARAAVGVGPMTWDEGLAAGMASYIESDLKASCQLVHSQPKGEYGENLSLMTNEMKPAEGVQMWIDEGKTYDYNANCCAGGDVCGHYTQVIWKNSVKLGCAQVMCDTEGSIVGCRYTPPGNYVGEKPW